MHPINRFSTAPDSLQLPVRKRGNDTRPDTARQKPTCNILLSKIPADAKIPVVVNGEALTSRSVRNAYRRLSPIENLTVESRGWTLDVLNVVRSLNKTNFVLADVYAKADYLGQLHCNNSHVRDKIRQQLQVLRDMGILEFLGNGAYRLI